MAQRYEFVMGAAALMLASMAGEQASAEVVSVGANGFEIRETAHTVAPSDKAYAALLLPARWWSSDHTFSGSAANLVLDARAGGCWCETLPGGGSVEHLRVAYVSPGKTLRLRGALGPFQGLGAARPLTARLQFPADSVVLVSTSSLYSARNAT